MRVSALRFSVALLLSVVGLPAMAVVVKDDPFKAYITFEGRSSSDKIDANTTRFYVVSGSIERNTRARLYVVQWGVVYRDREWRRYNSFNLFGGASLDFRDRGKNVSSCSGALRTCIYDENFHIHLSEAQMQRFAKEGLTFKTFARNGAEISTSISAGDMAEVLQAMRAHK